jgi:hypothetical protein
MASNFRISVNRKKDSLCLKLIGDFDGTSACELLNALKDKCNYSDIVFIHTSGLKEIYPFGRDTFQNNLYTLKDKKVHITFTGNKAQQIGPERSILF